MNKRSLPALALITLMAAGLAAWAAPAGQKDKDKDRESVYKFQEKEEVQKTLKFADTGKPITLSIDNVFGGIDVQSADVAAVELVAHKTIRAKTQDKIGKAKTDVVLKIEQTGNSIDVYVDGPFRCQVQDCKGLNWRDFGYEVTYEFVLKVPRRTDLTLKTVNGGDIAVKGAEGDFDVSNVNGKITLEGVAGSGAAHTVNGRVRAAFTRNPAGACSFHTINGNVELVFQGGLAADLLLKTMNGEAYSDFDSTRLPVLPVKRETREGKTVFQRNGFTSVRVGKGGPEFRCETLNGDILIKKVA
jgi:hypothetical protein